MTEDNSYSHSSNAEHAEPGYVGVALPGVQVRLSAEGEILIKSPGQFSGYYKQPELDRRVASPRTASSAPATAASCAPTGC